MLCAVANVHGVFEHLVFETTCASATQDKRFDVYRLHLTVKPLQWWVDVFVKDASSFDRELVEWELGVQLAGNSVYYLNLRRHNYLM